MLRRKSVYFYVAVCLMISQQAMAQFTQSSYSIFGLGDIHWDGTAQHAGMAGLGISNGNKFYVNTLNPALQAINYEAVFQTGLAVDRRSFTNGEESYSSTTGSFRDLAFTLPIVLGKWNLGFSLTPYSTVNFGFQQTQPAPENSTSEVDFSGDGGIDELALTSSFKLGNLLLGFEGAYYFGQTRNVGIFELQGVQQVGFGTTQVQGRRSYSQVSATVGAVYRLPVGENRFINFGGFYSPGFDLGQKTLITFDNLSQQGGSFSTDTLVFDYDQNLSITIPNRVGFGLSYQQSAKLTIGVDLQLQDWADFRGGDGLPLENLDQAFRLAIGGSYIPNFSQTTSSILEVISYRLGVHYEQTPYFVSGENIDDFGLSLGFSIPLNAVWGYSNINFGMTIGSRGNINTVNLIRENYLKFSLGFSLQDITWFAKQRFN